MNGEKLRELRESKGLTRRQVSIATGITEETIRAVEVRRGSNPTLKTISALADFYGVPIGELVGEEA